MVSWVTSCRRSRLSFLIVVSVLMVVGVSRLAQRLLQGGVLVLALVVKF